MRRNAIVMASVEEAEYSLEELGYAIVNAPRSDTIDVCRAFVRTRRGEVLRQTPMLRMRPRPIVSSDSLPTMPLSIIAVARRD